jgi:hypothetical protein
MLFSCSQRTTTRIGITDDTLFGDISEGQPEKDSLMTIKREGVVIGEGRFAMTERYVSNIKVGEWREYNDSGLLKSTGSYKIGSFLDCCTGGLCRSFYYYRMGVWKFYNEKGEMEFEINFEPTKLRVKTGCGGDSLIYGIVKIIPLKYWETLTTDKIYEIQKIRFDDLSGTTTYTPLNGELFMDYMRRK